MAITILKENNFADSVKTKEQALTFIEINLPSKDADAGRWLFYNEAVIDLIYKFKISKEELKAAQERGKELN